MNYFIYPDADTTIYQASSSQNTGLDEILEVRKDLNDAGSNPKVSRTLIKFDINEISQSMHTGIISTNAKNQCKINIHFHNEDDLERIIELIVNDK